MATLRRPFLAAMAEGANERRSRTANWERRWWCWWRRRRRRGGRGGGGGGGEEEEGEEEDSPPLASRRHEQPSQWPNRVPRPLARAGVPRHAYDRSTFTLVVGHKAASGRRPTSA